MKAREEIFFAALIFYVIDWLGFLVIFAPFLRRVTAGGFAASANVSSALEKAMLLS